MKKKDSKHTIEVDDATFATIDALRHVTTATSGCCASTPSPPYGLGSAYKLLTSFDDIYIGGISVFAVLQRLVKDMSEKKDTVPDTNLELVRTFSAEELAKFIIHTSKHIVSGGGDSVSELTAWLNSNTE